MQKSLTTFAIFTLLIPTYFHIAWFVLWSKYGNDAHNVEFVGSSMLKEHQNIFGLCFLVLYTVSIIIFGRRWDNAATLGTKIIFGLLTLIAFSGFILTLLGLN